MMLFANFPVRAAEQKYWALTPYQIQITLVVDTTARPQPKLLETLQNDLQQRISTTLHPLWSVEFSIPQGKIKRRLLNDLSTCDQDLFGEAASRFDKLMILTVVADATGYDLRCRELDGPTQRWGPVLRSNPQQAASLSCRCFELLRETFAPLALVRSDPKDEKSVLLDFKGSNLPRQTDESLFASHDDVFQPMLVRTSRTGEFLPKSIREVPWTYLTLTEPSATSQQWGCEIRSGLRRPFSRRRGRVQQVALAMRSLPEATRVRFYAKHDQTQSLAGYEVFERSPKDQPSRRLGLTDARGSIVIRRGTSPVTTLLLRSDGKLLAKVPVVPGAQPILEVPIADDTARLRAQSGLTALREQLVDLAARRKILITQTPVHLEKGRLDKAQAALSKLDKLLGRAQFDRLITSSQQNPRNISEDSRIQAGIEKLYADTRKLLGRFLSAREISDLQNELRNQRRSAQAGT